MGVSYDSPCDLTTTRVVPEVSGVEGIPVQRAALTSEFGRLCDAYGRFRHTYDRVLWATGHSQQVQIHLQQLLSSCSRLQYINGTLQHVYGTFMVNLTENLVFILSKKKLSTWSLHTPPPLPPPLHRGPQEPNDDVL